MSTQALLFDYDGVLVQTEPVRAETHAETVARFGGATQSSFYFEIGGVGRPHEWVRRAYIAKSGVLVSEEEYAAVFASIFHARLKTLRLATGLSELLAVLAEYKLLLAVVSSSPDAEVRPLLEANGLLKRFAAVVCGDEAACKKPAPNLYLLALARLGIKAKQALAIEDSESGIAAARSAGIQVIGFRHLYNAGADFKSAWEIVHSIEDLRICLGIRSNRVPRIAYGPHL